MRCPFCGEPETLEIFEIWDHDFQIDTCCEARHEAFCLEMSSDDGVATNLLRKLDVDSIARTKLRRVADDGISWLLDYTPEIREISRQEAKDFVRRHHEHCPPPAGDRFRASIWNGPTLLGVIMVGRPVARAYPQDRWIEVNRLCLRRDIPAVLRWNACSQLYGWAAREGRKRGFEKVITYTLEAELGTTLRAVGWQDEGLVGRPGKTWNCPSRPRENLLPVGVKRRWSKILQSTKVKRANPAAQ